jgi:hypothetical protein
MAEQHCAADQHRLDVMTPRTIRQTELVDALGEVEDRVDECEALVRLRNTPNNRAGRRHDGPLAADTAAASMTFILCVSLFASEHALHSRDELAAPVA